MKVHADLKPSRMRRVLEVGLYLVVALLCVLGDLPLWATVLTIVLLLIGLVVQTLRAALAPQLLQLVQLDRRAWCWYEATRSPQHGMQSSRVDAELRQVQRVGPLIVLRFQSPACTWLIWCDQVDVDNWRRLVVLARLWSDPVEHA